MRLLPVLIRQSSPAADFPLPPQQGKDELALPAAFLPAMLQVVCLLTETQPEKKSGRRFVFSTRHCRDPMHGQHTKHVIKKAPERFRCISPALMTRRQRDAKFHLPAVFETVQAAIAEEDVLFLANDGQLKPPARHARFHTGLRADEFDCIFQFKRFP